MDTGGEEKIFLRPESLRGMMFKPTRAKRRRETGTACVSLAGPRHPAARAACAAPLVPPGPGRTVATDLPDQDEYEVLVYDTRHHRRLVAAVEIISPANKDRPEHRRVFAAMCAALLRQHLAVAIVDLVTTRQLNLYSELLPGGRPQANAQWRSAQAGGPAWMGQCDGMRFGALSVLLLRTDGRGLPGSDALAAAERWHPRAVLSLPLFAPPGASVGSTKFAPAR